MVASAFSGGQRRGPDDGAVDPAAVWKLPAGTPTMGPVALLVTPVIDPGALDRVCEQIREKVQRAVAEGFAAAAEQMHLDLIIEDDLEQDIERDMRDAGVADGRAGPG